MFNSGNFSQVMLSWVLKNIKEKRRLQGNRVIWRQMPSHLAQANTEIKVYGGGRVGGGQDAP